MTNTEFDKVIKEARERNARTAFPANVADDHAEFTHQEHAEYGASQH